MGLEKIRRALALAGALTIGGDVKLERKAANRAGLATGDVLDQSGTAHSLRVPDADAYPTLANDGEIVVVSALPGTARIYWRALGTTYYADAS